MDKALYEDMEYIIAFAITVFIIFTLIIHVTLIHIINKILKKKGKKLNLIIYWAINIVIILVLLVIFFNSSFYQNGPPVDPFVVN